MEWGLGCGWGLDAPAPPVRNDIVTPRHLFTLTLAADTLDQKASLKVAGVVGEIINVGTIDCELQVQY